MTKIPSRDQIAREVPKEVGDEPETTVGASQEVARSDKHPEGRLAVWAGRGDGGKTFHLKWAAERAMRFGRQLYLADADPINPMLAKVFPDIKVLKPGDQSDTSRGEFIRRLSTLAKTSGQYVSLDIGGNDREFGKTGQAADPEKLKRISGWGLGNLQFAAFPSKLVTWFSLRGAINDLGGLELLLDSAVGKEEIVLVHNHGKAPVLPNKGDPFKAMIEHEIYQRALKAGARVFNMPALPPHLGKLMDDYRLTFTALLTNNLPKGVELLDGWEQEAVAMFLGDMEDEVTKSGTENLLP